MKKKTVDLFHQIKELISHLLKQRFSYHNRNASEMTCNNIVPKPPFQKYFSYLLKQFVEWPIKKYNRHR